MKREHYSLHFVFSLQLGCRVCVGSALESWLVSWADTDRLVESYELGGPEFEYEHRGKKQSTKVPLVVHDERNQSGYWDTLDDRGAFSTKPHDVKRSHAELRGQQYRLFTSSFFEENVVERKNRLQAHRWLHAAHGTDLRQVEAGIRLSTARSAKTFLQLSDEMRCSVVTVQVAALRLWKRGRVQLPLHQHLLGHPQFPVGGPHHGT